MDYSKIIIAALGGIITVLSLTGVITTEEAKTLTTSGGSAVAGVYLFVSAIIGIVKDHKKGKKDTPEEKVNVVPGSDE